MIFRLITKVFLALLAFWFSLSNTIVFAFNNPTQNPPSGSGAVSVDAQRRVGIGATAPGSRLTIVPLSPENSLSIRNSGDTADQFVVDNSGVLTLGSIPW